GPRHTRTDGQSGAGGGSATLCGGARGSAAQNRRDQIQAACGHRCAGPDPCPIRRYRGGLGVPDATEVGTRRLCCLCRLCGQRGQKREEAAEDAEEDGDTAAIADPAPIYHPRSATTALFKCRRSATIVRAPAKLSCSPRCAPA